MLLHLYHGSNVVEKSDLKNRPLPFMDGTEQLIPWYDRCLGLCSNAVEEQFVLYSDISISVNN
jgi:hypothetical protein